MPPLAQAEREEREPSAAGATTEEEEPAARELTAAARSFPSEVAAERELPAPHPIPSEVAEEKQEAAERQLPAAAHRPSSEVAAVSPSQVERALPAEIFSPPAIVMMSAKAAKTAKAAKEMKTTNQAVVSGIFPGIKHDNLQPFGVWKLLRPPPHSSPASAWNSPRPPPPTQHAPTFSHKNNTLPTNTGVSGFVLSSPSNHLNHSKVVEEEVSTNPLQPTDHLHQRSEFTLVNLMNDLSNLPKVAILVIGQVICFLFFIVLCACAGCFTCKNCYKKIFST